MHIPKGRNVYVYPLVESIYLEKVSTIIGKEAVLPRGAVLRAMAGEMDELRSSSHGGWDKSLSVCAKCPHQFHRFKRYPELAAAE